VLQQESSSTPSIDGLIVARRAVLYTRGTSTESAGIAFTALSPAGTGEESAEAPPRRMKLMMKRRRIAGARNGAKGLDRVEDY
jgi:hypothetical protein